MRQTDVHVIIMAGGVGSRFWPMSTPSYPKQFIDVMGTQILAIIILVCFIYLCTNRVIKYIGVIFSSLFVVHPVFRMIVNNTMDSKNMLLLASFLYIFLTISGGAIHNYIVNKFK